MGYRSIRRVLGETSLERKCRLLFGTCLLVLITGAFWWVDSIAENLVKETTRNHGRDLVDIIMIKAHAEKYFTDEPEASGNQEDKAKREVLKEIIATLLGNQNYESQIVSLDPDYPMIWIEAQAPANPAEARALRELEEQLKLQQEQQAEALAAPEAAADLALAGQDASQAQPLPHAEGELPSQDQFLYYEPIPLTINCRGCHFNLAIGALPISEIDTVEPIYVVKVVMPYKDIRDDINSARAILIAVAILTVFVAMVVLYMIIRYVVIRPLKHLRDVSDEVSRGNTELRAEIRTGDEFQELAQSFNRMLRHLMEAQGKLRQVNTDLDGKVDELAQLNMRLYEMNRLKGDFLANMSHELRTPLNSIIGFSEVLQGIDALNDKQRRYAGNIRKSGRVLLEMINDILDLAKMEAGKMEVKPSEFRIDAVVHAQCDMVRSLSEDKNIDLTVQVQPDTPLVFQDQGKVQQILTNLLSNAIKFTPEGGRIEVAAGQDPQGRLVLSVKDTGVGIAEDDREIIFEKFRQSGAGRRGESLTREYSGTGLGLSIIKELCKLLEGEIKFASELGMGSTFQVVLPWTCSQRPRLDARIHAQWERLAQDPTAAAIELDSATSSANRDGSATSGTNSSGTEMTETP